MNYEIQNIVLAYSVKSDEILGIPEEIFQKKLEFSFYMTSFEKHWYDCYFWSSTFVFFQYLWGG